MHKDTQDQDLNHTDCPGNRGGYGPDTELFLRFRYTQRPVDNPEVGIVEVAEEQGAHAAGDCAKHRADSAGGDQDRSGDAGRGGHGDRTGALHKAHQRGDHQGQQDQRDRGACQAVGDVSAQSGVGDDAAMFAALSEAGAFEDVTSRKIFEESKGFLA